jgi:hypothetical protein
MRMPAPPDAAEADKAPNARNIATHFPRTGWTGKVYTAFDCPHTYFAISVGSV